MESRRWTRCGSGGGRTGATLGGRTSALTHATASFSDGTTITELRAGLSRAENPHGVLRGRVRPNPASINAIVAPSRRPSSSSNPPSTNHDAIVSITGQHLNLLEQPQPAQPPPRPRPIPPERPDRLRAGRAAAVVKFRGDENRPDDWCCAICLRTDWHKHALSRMPKCGHVFHTSCVAKWFERASICPTCRQPV